MKIFWMVLHEWMYNLASESIRTLIYVEGHFQSISDR